MQTIKKTSDTSIRVLETLKMLYRNSASIQDIIHYFENDSSYNKTFTNEVVLKYINTLKVFGLRFTKKKDKYILLNSFNQFEFNDENLKSIFLLEKIAEIQPEERIKSEINKFLQGLEKQFSDNSRLLAHSITKSEFISFDFASNKYSKEIKEYEKYCIQGLKLKITYNNQDQTTSLTMIEPKEIKYEGNDVFLRVYNPIAAHIQDINFNSIIKIEQLPQKSNPNNMLSSATFILKDRLAKSYKLHTGEKLLETKSDGSIIILNQQEDRTLLLKRLMRYNVYCEVLSPKSLRDDMKNMIQATIKNYI